MKSKHPAEYKICQEETNEDINEKNKKKQGSKKTQSTLPGILAKSTKYEANGPRQTSLDNALLEMVATDMQPSSIVDDKGFGKFVRLLDSRYQLPSRRTLMRRLPGKYDEVKIRVKNQLNSSSHVCLTTDIWTSRTTQGYLTVTCHFINTSWKMQSFVLETFNLCASHTAENIAATLKRVADEWNITEKIVALVTDNAANVVAAARILGWKHIPCFAHTLNLIVQAAISADTPLAHLKKKCKDIVTFFHHSAKATDKLREIQKQLGIPEAKLMQEVETRWNSTFYMFKRIIEQQEAVTTTLCLQGKNELCLSLVDIEEIKHAVKVLQPFETATTEMSAENYVSISKIIPIARSLQQLTGNDASHGVNKELVAQMRQRFVNMEGNVSLAKSTLLDPRFKKLAFLNSAASRTSAESLVQDMHMAALEAHDAEAEDVPTPLPKTTDELWQAFDSRVADRANTRQGMNESLFEVRQYFEEPVISREKDPLEWWHENSKHYPGLAKLALKYLCITASSVPSERLFSKAGELVSHRRSCLKPKNVDMLLFLNQNI